MTHCVRLLLSCVMVAMPATGASQSHILFSRSSGDLNAGGTLDLMRYDLESGVTTLVMQGSVRGRGEYGAATSPDGASILFNTYRFGGWKIGLGKLKDGAITDVRKWSDRAPYAYDARYSPDGSRVVYQEFDWGTREVDLFIADKDGRNPVPFVTSRGGDRTPDWTYDGRAIVFASGRGEKYSIYIKSVAGNDTRPLTDERVSAFASSTSKVAARIAYLSDAGGTLHLYTMSLDGSDKRNLTPSLDAGPFTVTGYEASGCWAMKTSWSPDGSRIAFNMPYQGNMELFVVNSDGSDLRQLTRNNDSDIAPYWMNE